MSEQAKLYYCPHCGRDVKKEEIKFPPRGPAVDPIHKGCGNYVMEKDPHDTTKRHFNAMILENLKETRQRIEAQASGMEEDAIKELIKFVHETLDGRRQGQNFTNVQALSELLDNTIQSHSVLAPMSSNQRVLYAKLKIVIKRLSQLHEKTGILLDMFRTNTPVPKHLCSTCHVELVQSEDIMYLICPKCHNPTPKGLL